MIESLALVIFPLLMVFSAFADLLTMTIPNRVSLALIVVYAVLAIYLPLPWPVVKSHVTCGLAVLLLTFVFFHFKWIGGGDAKLAATTALWVGWEHLLDYGLIASIGGGLLTVSILALRRQDLSPRALSVGFIARLAEKSGGVPYGVALAVAGLLIYPQTGVWARLGGI